VTSEVGPGEAFGTWALVDESERGHRVECIEDGVALMLDRDDFYDVAAGDLTLLREVVRALTKRLRSMASKLPEEARIEGEGIEKPEALDETKSNALEIATSASSAAAAAKPATAGESLTAAALGQPPPENETATSPAEPEKISGETTTPESIVPVEPAKVSAPCPKGDLP
jgi:signal-transduction protein with cAMP-binding, CBS, and nucleotidyltransferase domain